MSRNLISSIIGAACIGVTMLSGSAPANAAGSHIDTIKQRGVLLCGTDNTEPGFGYLNTKTGKMEGLDVDYCRAAAAAVLGDPSKVKFVIVTDKSRFNALLTGEVDVVFAHSTVTLTREASIGVSFLPINFYDGTGILVKTALGVHHVSDLNGATICTTQGSGTEIAWANYAKAHNWNSTTKILTYQNDEQLFAALNSGRCNAMSTDKSALAGWKGNAPDPKALEILPETIDKSPLAGFTVSNDPKWHTLLRWLCFALIQAEESGITSENVAKYAKTSDDPYIQKFLGVNGNFGKLLGVAPDFVQLVIKAVGNYGEIYDRNLGPNTPYAIERKGSLNALWTDGGLMYSPPWY